MAKKRIELLSCNHLNNLALSPRWSGYCMKCNDDRTIVAVYNQNLKVISHA